MVKLEGAEKEGAITPSETAHKLLQGGECHRVTDGSMEMSLNAIRRSDACLLAVPWPGL